MKKKVITALITLTALLCLIHISGNTNNNSDANSSSKKESKAVNKTKNYKKISVLGSNEYYDYNELKEESDIIALVECQDNIEYSNSTFYYDEGLMIGFSATRKVNVLETYKGKNLKSLEILEPAAVTESDELLFIEEYEVLEKGKKYIVFLSNDTYTGQYSLISGNNGKIDTTKIQDNEFFDIAIKSIIEYESDLNVKEKEEFLEATIMPKKNLNNSEEVLISDIDSEINYLEKDNVIYVDIQE